MSTFMKISLTLLGLVMVLLILAVVRVATLDPNNYRDWITEQFAQQTGRQLVLEGDIGLSLYPWLGLNLEGVTVGSPAGFGDTPMLQAGQASVRVKTLPLLRERYEIDTVLLRDVSLNLVVNEVGIGNWQDLATREDGSAGDDGSAGGMPLTRLIIGGVDVNNVSIRYEDQRTGQFYQVSDLAFNIGDLVYGTPIDLAMTFTAATSQPQLTADVELAGTLNYDLDNNRYALAPLQLESRLDGATLPDGGAVVALTTALEVDLAEDTLRVSEFNVTGLSASLTATFQGREISTDRPVIDGELALSGSDLATLVAAGGSDQLAERLGALDDRSFNLSASGTLAGGSAPGIAVPTMQASLLGAGFAGNIDIAESGGGELRAAGNVTASGPDLPLVIEVLGQVSGGGESMLVRIANEMRRVSDREFSVNLEFDADTANGSVVVPTLEARLAGASVSGRLRAIDINSEAPGFSGSLSAAGPDLPLLLQIGAGLQGGLESALYQASERLRSGTNGNFNVNVEFDADLEQGDISVPSLSASALGFQLSGELDASAMTDRNGTIDGRLAIESNSPGPVLAAFGQAALGEVMERFSVNLAVSGGRSDLAVSPIEVDLGLSGPRIADSPTSVQMNASSQVNLDRDSLVVDSFSVSGLGLDIQGDIEVERLRDEPYYQGRVVMADFNLRSLLRQLNQPDPATRNPASLQQVGLETRFEGSASRLALDGIVLNLDDTGLQGSLAVNSFSPPSAEFTLEIDRLNVDDYLASAADNPAPGNDAEAETRIPVDQLRNLTLLGEAQIGELTVSGLQLGSVYATVNATGGELNLAPLAAELYRGSYEGAVRLSVTGARPEAHLEATLQGVDLDPLMSDLLDASYLSGRATVDLAVSASGETVTALQETLSGSGRLAVEDGVLQGVDVAAVLRQLETMLRSRRAGELQRGTSTAFDSFSSTVVINNGVIRSDDMLIQSPGFRIAGRGTLLNLATNAINFNLTTEVDQSTATLASEEYDIGGYSLPIACTGTLEQPRCLPDAGEILRARLQREVQNRVIDLLDRSLGGQRDATDAQTDTTPTPDSPPAAQSQPQTEQEAQTETQAPAEPEDLGDQLLNRALERIFN